MEESVNCKELLLFVDTETTGIPNDETRSYKDVDNWPSIRQISWLVCDKYGTRLSERDYYTGCQSPDYAGIDDGWDKITPIYDVLPEFLDVIHKCAIIIGHNIQYDVNVILCELYRFGHDTAELEKLPQFCTMQNGVATCSFETTHGDRYPKLQELYTKLFHRPFQNAHNSYYDIVATADCFWELFNQGYLDKCNYPLLLDESEKRKQVDHYVQEGNSILILHRWGKNDVSDSLASSRALSEYEKASEYCYDRDSRESVAKELFNAGSRMMKPCSDKYYQPFLEKSAELDYPPALYRLACEIKDFDKKITLLKSASFPLKCTNKSSGRC